MPKGPETKLQKKIQDELKKAYPGCFFFKSHGGLYQTKGLPDLIGCINGHFIAIEVKTPDKIDTVTELQRAAIHSINMAGGIAFVSWCPEHALNFIRNRMG